MNLVRQITINEVLCEWLRAEWYKKSFDNIRNQYSYLVDNPSFSNNDSELRKSLMLQIWPDVVKPLLELPFTWYLAKLDNHEELNELYIITSDDWYLVTGKSFKSSNTFGNFYLNDTHRVDIEKKKEIRQFTIIPQSLKICLKIWTKLLISSKT